MPGAGQRLTLRQKAMIRDHFAACNPSTMRVLCEWVTAQFGFSPHRTTIQRIVRDTRRHDYIDTKALSYRNNVHAPRYPELEQELYQWIILANDNNCCLTGDVIVRKAQQLALRMGLDDGMHFSKGWLHRFQRRRGLQMYRLHGEAASASPEDVSRGRADLQTQLSLYDPCDIYNMDETGVFYNYQPSTTISHEPRKGTKKDKSRLTVVLAANSDGSDKQPLTFIGKAARPRCFGNLGNAELSVLYRSNRKAWMTIALFAQWIVDLNGTMRAAERSVLLVLDNASSHKTVGVDLTNVRVLLLPPNTTAWLQPMDAGIIAAFKRHYKRRQVEHVIDALDRCTELVGSKKNPYAVDVLTAMRWMSDAWEQVSPSAISNCWGHTGILPSSTLATQMTALRISPATSLRHILN